MTKEASRKIIFLNLIMTLCIIFYHVRSIPLGEVVTKTAAGETIYSWFCCINNSLVGSIAMAFFFMMSGYLFYFNITAENGVKESLKKMKSRLYTLLLPYISWAIIATIYFSPQITSFKYFLNSLFFRPMCGVTWYLLALLILMLVSPLLAFSKKNKVVMNIILVCLISFFGLYGLKVIPNFHVISDWWWFGNMMSYSTMYFIGAFIGLNFGSKAINFSLPKIKHWVLTAFAVLVFFIIELVLCKLTSVKVFYIVLILTPILLWIIIPNELFKKDIPKFFNYSFFAYTSHSITIPVLTAIYALILPLTTINAGFVIAIRIISVPLCYLMAVLIAIICKVIFAEKVYCALSGNRVNKTSFSKNIEEPKNDNKTNNTSEKNTTNETSESITEN